MTVLPPPPGLATDSARPLELSVPVAFVPVKPDPANLVVLAFGNAPVVILEVFEVYWMFELLNEAVIWLAVNPKVKLLLLANWIVPEFWVYVPEP